MFYVLRQSPTTSGYTDKPTDQYTETRVGRRFKNQKAAEALAKLHLGRVLDLNTHREVANYLAR